MSLLDRGNKDILFYPEVAVEDRDGNVRTRPSDTPVPLRVQLEPQGQSGTAARRSEQDNEGYETEKVLRMRLRRQDRDLVIGAQACVEIDGQRWSVFGDEWNYYSSPTTRHRFVLLRRS